MKAYNVTTLNMGNGKMVKLDGDVYAYLTEIGRKGETYSDIVRRLAEEYKASQLKKETAAVKKKKSAEPVL